MWIGPTLRSQSSEAQDRKQNEDPGSEENETGVSLLSLVADSLENEPERFADTALHQAAQAGELDRVLALLLTGTEVDTVGGQGRSPLMTAIAATQLEVARALLAAGANPQAQDHAGNSPLFYAASGGPEAARLLLEHGANAHTRNALGQTPLAGAALLGKAEVVSLLLAAGAPVTSDSSTCRGRCGRGALAQATLGGHLDIAKTLLANGAEIDPILGDDRRLLHLAADRGNATAVGFLLDNGADPDTRAGTTSCCPKETPLIAAARAGHPNVIQQLVKGGADLEAYDAEGVTPLQWAAREGHHEVSRNLLTAKARADNPGRETNRSPPLLLATMAGHLETAKTLLEGGADPNTANRRGATPLIAAAYQGQLPLVQHLLSHRADPNIANRTGHTPLVYATVRAHPDVVRSLLEHRAKPNVTTQIEAFGDVTPLMLAAGRNHLEITRDLLRFGAQVDTVCDVKSFGVVTPLLLAAARGFAEIVEVLLANGADPSLTDDQGQTPHARALAAGHSDVATRIQAAVSANRSGI